MGVKIRPSKLILLSFSGILTGFGLFACWVVSDYWALRILDKYRSQIEDQLTKPLGHPVVIGPYKGLRPWGIAIGPSKILEGVEDRSKASFEGLVVKLAPIASLVNWRPVAIIRPEGAEIDLISNKDGMYWVTGKPDKNKPPNLDIQLRLIKPANISFKSQNITLKATSKTSFKLFEKLVSGRLSLEFPDKGSLSIKGRSYWDRLNVNAKTKIKNLEITNLNNLFLMKNNLNTNGKINGEMKVGTYNGNLSCNGEIELAKFQLKGSNFYGPISSEKAAINCDRELINFPLSKWEYGPWVASFRGLVPLTNKDKKFTLNAYSSIGFKGVAESELKIKGLLPFQFLEKEILLGDVLADLDLKSLPLSPIGQLFKTSMAGSFNAKGEIKGPINNLMAKFLIGVENPQISGVRLQEKWAGEFLTLPSGGAGLKMASSGAALPGNLYIGFAKDWSIDELSLNRLGGNLSVKSKKQDYIWKAKNLRLDRVEVAIPPEKSFKRIFGDFSGEGNLSINPLSFDGQLIINYARLLGLRLREARLRGDFSGSNYSLNGKLFPSDNGNISIDLNGNIGGSIDANAKVDNVSAKWLLSTALEVPKFNLEGDSILGNIKDLGELNLTTYGDSIDEKLSSLSNTQANLRRENRFKDKKKVFNLSNFKGNIDALVKLKGPSLSDLKLDLKVFGDIFPEGNKDFKYKVKPLVASISGPVQGGVGKFSFINIPFSLLSLVTPVPSSLSGMFGLSGVYKIGKGNPEVSADLVVKNARLHENEFFLEKGTLLVKNSSLEIDIVLRSKSSTEKVKFNGNIPFDPLENLNLRMESHGDGIRFFEGLTDGSVNWKKGNADLRLLVKGTISSPEINGFLVIKEGEFIVMEKPIKDINASILFDFDRIEVQNLTANIGTNGSIRSKGSIALFSSSLEERNPLNLKMKEVPLRLPVADIKVSSDLIFDGTLLSPLIAGNLNIKEGFISPKKNGNRRGNGSPGSESNKNFLSTDQSKQLPEQIWDRKEPLVLFVQDENAPASKMLKGAISKRLSNIRFNNLRLKLGPNLRITSQPLANFKTSGLLILNGSLDRSLKPRGLVRLKNGRVNLFTTTFDLEKREPNVAIFTPSLGLIPYVDVKMTSRVPDTVRDASNLASSSDFASNGSGAFGIGGSRFIKVELTASGPADRLSDNFQLRSTPPMPSNQLLGLIGGNSLTRLLAGGEREVLVDLLSKSLISPVLGNIAGAFSDRLQVSLYPAYISSPEVVDESSSDTQSSSNDEASGSLSSQQAWVAEMGVDLSKRFNLSIQATPNRKDIPPQGTLTFQINSQIGVLGSLDNQGTLKSQIQMFLRF